MLIDRLAAEPLPAGAATTSPPPLPFAPVLTDAEPCSVFAQGWPQALLRSTELVLFLSTLPTCSDADPESGNYPGTVFAQDYQWVREYNTSIRVDDKGEPLLSVFKA